MPLFLYLSKNSRYQFAIYRARALRFTEKFPSDQALKFQVT